MTKLTDNHKQTMALLVRSPQDSEGWATASPVVHLGLMSRPANAHPDLIEVVPTDDGGARCRLTPEGLIVAKWCL